MDARTRRLLKLLPLLRKYYHISRGNIFNNWIIENDTIIGVSDSYFDPILTIINLILKEVIIGTFEHIYHEIDKIVITDVDLVLFNEIQDQRLL